jgi:outer membrane lipoprotein-sorting protein
MRIIILLAAVFLANAAPAASSEAKKWLPTLNKKEVIQKMTPAELDKYKAQISQAEGYLKRLNTFSAEFYQATVGSNFVSEGKLSFAKPGKARWEYSSPKEVLIVIDNDDVVVYDKKLDQTTYTNMPKKTALNLFFGNDLDFSKNATVTSVVDSTSELKLVITGKDYKGQFLTITFDKKGSGLLLSKVGRITEKGEVVNIKFATISENIALDKDLFVFKNQKIFKRNE